MAERQLDPAQKFFLRMIQNFTPDDIRDAVMNDIDLARLLLSEYGPEMIDSFKNMVKVYDLSHPGQISNGLKDFRDSAFRVLEWLKEKRPDLGYEIDAFAFYPTAMNIGLVLQSVQAMKQAAQDQTEHVGLAWIAKNLESLAQLLLQ